jgi:hypothetical protein
MDFSIPIQYVAVCIIPVLAGMGAFIMKSLLSRLENVEQAVKANMTESEVRQLLDDKLDGIKSDIHEIKDAVKQLFEIYVQGRE